MDLSSLTEWESFYVIVGSSAAGLTGLTFVVIALAADARRVNTTGLSAFLTPTVVHFGSVLALSAFLSMPHPGFMSLSIGWGAGAVAGLIYVGNIVSRMRRNAGDYIPVREDWLWHVILPTLVYVFLLAMAFTVWRHPEQSLYGVGLLSVLVLFIGIHNAWDIAVYISVNQQKEPS